MNQYLADALRDPAEPWIADIFYEGFQTARRWRRFFRHHFRDGVSTILDQDRDSWHRVDFQALYIACWTYKPVVKGSYMLRLDDDGLGDVQRAYKKKLKSRWSSHLNGNTDGGADASKGWKFLRGYHELLVQIEPTPQGTYLFLKCEGHPAVSYAHMKSWNHKRKHGVGLDVNADLLTLASDDERNLGIKVRAAENYSPTYKNLMRQLGYKKLIKKKGEIVDAHTAAAAMASVLIEELHSRTLRMWLARQLQPIGVRLDRPGFEDRILGLSNRRLSVVFHALAEFPAQALAHLAGGFWGNPLLVAMREARRDLASISSQLRNDYLRGNNNTARYFEEVVVHPDHLDYGLNKAFNLLSLPKGS